MVSAILLTVALGQVNAFDGPPREWLPGQIAGRTVQLWGWRDASGGVRYYPHENPQVYTPYMTPAVYQPLSPGQTINRDGTLNNGLMLQSTRPTGTLETNDPGLAEKLEQRCLNDEPEPEIPPDHRKPNLRALLEQYAVPIACILCGGVLLLARRRQP